MTGIKEGTCFETHKTVEESDLAVSVGSGDLKVFATPTMIALMENAATKCLQPFLEKDESSVGTLVNIKHLSATPLGMKVKARAKIAEVDRCRIVFEIEAFDEKECIGKGTHERFIIDIQRFMEKTKIKLETHN